MCTLPIVYFFNDAKIQINLYNCKIFEKRFGSYRKFVYICSVKGETK